MKIILTALALIVAGTGLSFANIAPASDATVVTPDKATTVLEARRKQRIPGGSGCDDAQDRAEHAECRG
ncbi:MAG: hypothetical protein IPM06_03390 [Rhizobiales bacterium]|nr:hypothetical protein [Hyphomicrobiales bacterium]